MRIELGHSAIKFFEKLDEKTKVKIKERINFLRNQITEFGIIPIKSLDIKSLKGQWEPYKRLRIGKIRIIFIIDKENDVLSIYDIDNRGDVYK